MGIRRKYFNQKALTLVEIVVALLILSLTMAGLVNIFIAGKRYILHSRSRMSGGELGKLFLDPLQMQVRQDEWGNNCLSAGIGCPGAESLQGITYTPTYQVNNVSGTNLRRVKVIINWQEPSA
jgi:Tfp pilus assembly protein PilV